MSAFILHPLPLFRSYRFTSASCTRPKACLPTSPSPPSFISLVPSTSPYSPESDPTSLDPSFSPPDSPPGSPPSGGGGDGGQDEGNSSNDPLAAVLEEHKVTRKDIPSDILDAYNKGYISSDNISNYFVAKANVLSRLLMRCGSGMRNRFLADKFFLLKILIEEGIGVFGKLGAEYEQRRQMFWKETEFVVANLITAILADFALVYLPAPSISLTRGQSGSGFAAWIARLSEGLPSNIFQTDRPFTIGQRFGGFVLKGGQLFVVGMMCCFVGSALTNGMVYVLERVDKNYVPKTEKPNVLAVSALYATFLGVSSGSRYQLVNGIESHIFPRVFKTTPRIVEEAATFALRYGNTFWGSQQWVMFTKFTKVQRSKTE